MNTRISVEEANLTPLELDADGLPDVNMPAEKLEFLVYDVADDVELLYIDTTVPWSGDCAESPYTGASRGKFFTIATTSNAYR